MLSGWVVYSNSLRVATSCACASVAVVAGNISWSVDNSEWWFERHRDWLKICYGSNGKTCLEDNIITRVATDSGRDLCGSETEIGLICERLST
jgi:hypothetical protein